MLCYETLSFSCRGFYWMDKSIKARFYFRPSATLFNLSLIINEEKKRRFFNLELNKTFYSIKRNYRQNESIFLNYFSENELKK
jgi:hypothetical protein